MTAPLLPTPLLPAFLVHDTAPADRSLTPQRSSRMPLPPGCSATSPCSRTKLTFCGAFGICSRRSQPPCQCPPGFASVVAREWGLNDWSGGCSRRVSLHFVGNESTDGFMELQASNT
jgi:hypothetical protein